MEVIAEVGLLFVSVAVGFAFGSLVYLVVRGARWLLLRTERSAAVTDPHGRRWTVQVPFAPPPMRFWASLRLFGMRAGDRRRRVQAGVAADGVGPSELANPTRLVSHTDETAGLVAVVMLALVLVGVAVLLVEIVLALLVATAMCAVGLLRGAWRCEVIDPEGRRIVEPIGSLRAARARCRELKLAIELRGAVEGLAG